ncbi:MAG: hypothetical protein ACAI44_06570 [Candidatus Sericytochromatia bacterium]
MSLGCALLGAPGLAPAEAQETGAGGGPQFLIGPQAELDFVRGPNYPGDPSDSRAGLLLGIYAGTSGLELIPSILISEGQYKGFLVDAGLRITPKWFGQDEYLFNLVSPYAVLGGSLGYPWSVGWHVKAGLGVALMEFGSINAEIGYRSHRFDPNIQLDGVSIALRATYPF